MYSSTLDSQKLEMEKVFKKIKNKKYTKQSLAMMENNHACQEIEVRSATPAKPRSFSILHLVYNSLPRSACSQCKIPIVT